MATPSAATTWQPERWLSHGALSLYWCQGLSTCHHVLNKNVSRLQELGERGGEPEALNKSKE